MEFEWYSEKERINFVVYTERGNKNRIITARKAEPEERRIYYGECTKGNWFIP